VKNFTHTCGGWNLLRIIAIPLAYHNQNLGIMYDSRRQAQPHAIGGMTSRKKDHENYMVCPYMPRKFNS